MATNIPTEAVNTLELIRGLNEYNIPSNACNVIENLSLFIFLIY